MPRIKRSFSKAFKWKEILKANAVDVFERGGKSPNHEVREADCLARDDNHEIKRNAILAHVGIIKCVEMERYQFELNFGASNYPVWLPRQDSNLG